MYGRWNSDKWNNETVETAYVRKQAANIVNRLTGCMSLIVLIIVLTIAGKLLF